MATTLKNICSFQSGGTPSKANPAYFGGNIPWITTVALNGQNIGTKDAVDWITEEAIQESAAKIVPVGSVMVGTRVGIGKVAVNTVPMSTSQDIISLVGIDSESWDKGFLCRFIQSKNAYLNAQARGATIKGIKIEALASLVLPEASLQQQREIVLILNTISDVITARQRQLRAFDTLIKARFVEMFGDPVSNPKNWPVRPLLDMGDCKNGMNFHYDDAGVDLHCLGVGDFQDHSIIADTSSLSIVSLNELPSDEYMLQDDDIVFVRSNGNKALVGRCVAVYPGDVPTTFSGFCIRYRKRNEEITIPYLLRVLKTDSMRAKMAGRGANIQNLNQQILGTLIIPVPPLTLQEQFSAFVSQVDKSKSVDLVA